MNVQGSVHAQIYRLYAGIYSCTKLQAVCTTSYVVRRQCNHHEETESSERSKVHVNKLTIDPSVSCSGRFGTLLLRLRLVRRFLGLSHVRGIKPLARFRPRGKVTLRVLINAIPAVGEP